MGDKGDGAAGRVESKERDRARYAELLQEVRVVIPGVQVLFAFLLTAPFSARFSDLDDLGRGLYGVAVVGAAASMVALLAPTSYHRVAREASRDRLRSAIALTMVGMATLAATVLIVVFVVMRFIFAADVAAAVTAGLAVVLVGLWYIFPLFRTHR